MKNALPRWADVALLPAVCLVVALLVSAAVVALVGQEVILDHLLQEVRED